MFNIFAAPPLPVTVPAYSPMVQPVNPLDLFLTQAHVDLYPPPPAPAATPTTGEVYGEASATATRLIHHRSAKMSSTWREFMSWNKYTQIASRALRQALSEGDRVAAEKRAAIGVRYQVWQNGEGGEQQYVRPPPEEATGKPSGAV
ncbi:hypothetical protein I350_02625 [Cryptococcus amylolentus CBS 6273]|uniref:Uncharacterized protein n=1 Tax=Cryptococcus amylolentus CBS 6273 TaxID=1296118 RepID=A0A1E3K753_9TREE|nr:hypothetical protein I350_02625 [Cryptococcus amylolentus CBS 6273]